MTFSLTEFVGELEIILRLSTQSALETGSFSVAYELIFGLISVDENGLPVFSRGIDANGDNIVIDRSGDIVVRIANDTDGVPTLYDGSGQPLDLTLPLLSVESRLNDFSPADGVDSGAWVFLRGVPDVNRGFGDYSTFIREYSKAQFKLRFPDSDLTEAQLDALVQDTSDAIAENIMNDILNLDANQPNPNNLLPDIDRVAINDASAASELLFGENPDGTPSENIAGWAGNPFLVILGHTESYSANILNQGGDQSDPFDVMAMVASMKSVAASLGIAIGVDLVIDVLTKIIPDVGDFVENSGQAIVSVLDQTEIYLDNIYGDAVGLDDLILSNLTVDFLGANSSYLVPPTSQTAQDGNFVFMGDGDDIVFAALEQDTDGDTFDGGSGQDTLSYQNLSRGVVGFLGNTDGVFAESVVSLSPSGAADTLDVAYNFEGLTLTNLDDIIITQINHNFNMLIDGAGGYDEINYSSLGHAIEYTSEDGRVGFDGKFHELKNVEKIIGSGGNDTFTLSDQGNFIAELDGGAGADTVELDVPVFNEMTDTAYSSAGQDIFSIDDLTLQNIETLSTRAALKIIADTDMDNAVYVRQEVDYSAEKAGLIINVTEDFSQTIVSLNGYQYPAREARAA